MTLGSATISRVFVARGAGDKRGSQELNCPILFSARPGHPFRGWNLVGDRIYYMVSLYGSPEQGVTGEVLPNGKTVQRIWASEPFVPCC